MDPEDLCESYKTDQRFRNHVNAYAHQFEDEFLEYGKEDYSEGYVNDLKLA